MLSPAVAANLQTWRGGLVAAMALWLCAGGQAAGPEPQERTFEFVSIRRSAADAVHVVRTLPGGRFEARRTQLAGLVRLAHGLERHHSQRIAASQSWLYSEYFDLLAITGDDWSTPPVAGEYPPELRPMLRALLAGRFGVETREATRMSAVQALRLIDPASGPGPRLQPRQADCPQPVAGALTVPMPPSVPCGLRVGRTEDGGGWIGGSARIADLARVLSDDLLQAEDLVVDATGLAGTFDVRLTIEPSAVPAAVPRVQGRAFPVPAAAASRAQHTQAVRAALRDQLGLKLERTRAAVPVLMVERARRPEED